MHRGKKHGEMPLIAKKLIHHGYSGDVLFRAEIGLLVLSLP